MKQPKYIKLELVFEEDELNQHAMIDCSGCVGIAMESVPVFRHSVVTNQLDYSKVIQNVYTIIVDYGEDGLDVKT